MNLHMTYDVASGYRSGCQIARRVSEHWAAENLFCAACESDGVERARANTKAIDFACTRCPATYQLKAGRHWNERRIPDAGYSAMMEAIQSDNVPNLLVLQYSVEWQVENLMLIPSFFFNGSAIEKRNPLAATARRAGWVGCNILLSAMPDVGKLRIVHNGTVFPRDAIRQRYKQLQPLHTLAPTLRGWTLDVLRVIQGLSRREFRLEDIYAYEQRLLVLHPRNHNIRPKIRQQLQVLRDLRMLEFRGNGQYTLFV
jgi:type II restriction enzyme